MLVCLRADFFFAFPFTFCLNWNVTFIFDSENNKVLFHQFVLVNRNNITGNDQHTTGF